MKNYTRTQITEAIDHWKQMLNEQNYDDEFSGDGITGSFVWEVGNQLRTLADVVENNHDRNINKNYQLIKKIVDDFQQFEKAVMPYVEEEKQEYPIPDIPDEQLPF